MRVIVYTTNDKYRHIIYLTKTVAEMAKLTGKKANSIYSSISKHRAGVLRQPRFEFVDIEDD